MLGHHLDVINLDGPGPDRGIAPAGIGVTGARPLLEDLGLDLPSAVTLELHQEVQDRLVEAGVGQVPVPEPGEGVGDEGEGEKGKRWL